MGVGGHLMIISDSSQIHTHRRTYMHITHVLHDLLIETLLQNTVDLAERFSFKV